MKSSRHAHFGDHGVWRLGDHGAKGITGVAVAGGAFEQSERDFFACSATRKRAE